MAKKFRNNLYHAGLAILAGCVLCLASNIALMFMIRSDLGVKGKSAFDRDYSANVLSELRQEGSAIERSLLIDSILSIVQNYYVDPNRVDNSQILESTLRALGSHPQISYEKDGENHVINIQGHKKAFSFGDAPSYRETLKGLLTLANLIESHLTEQSASHSWHKQAENIIVNSLLSSLDAHSALLSPDAYRELKQGTEGSFGGLGVLVGIREKVLTVIKPLPRSPALRAGVRQRDRILSIDGKHTFGYGLDELVEHMRGDPGTLVRLMVLREGSQHPQMVHLTREFIKVDSVEASLIKNDELNILHLKIENFSSRTSQEVSNAILKHRSTYGKVDGVVLDLRSNPGGLLDQAVAVSSIFLQKGVILTTKGRRSEVESARSVDHEMDFPLMVLINGDSASASEIVSGALQDHDRAVVIGQPSFGKGSVQTIFELPNEQALKLTIARYYTPLGRSIQNVGIMPDIWTQPVIQRSENLNLLGSMRYKNERYLPNRLEGVTQSIAGSNHHRSFKGYYLIEKETDAYDTVRQPDVELDVARLVIQEVRKSYGEGIEAGGLRAGHWLALAAPAVKDKLRNLESFVNVWLEKSHSVDWQITANKQSWEPGLTLDIANNEILTAEIGGSVAIPWTLSNRRSQPVDRVSLFVNSGSAAFETQEILVGRLEGGSSKTGIAKLKVPPYLDAGYLHISLGFAIDSIPASSEVKQVTISLKKRPAAHITTFVSLFDERGGRPDGTLEPGEKAKLKITVTNTGQSDAGQVKARITNLSGNQVKILNPTTELKIVPKGMKRVMYIDIEGAPNLFSEELEFGLAIESEDMLEPVLQSITFSGRPNMGKIKEVTSLSH